MIQEVYIEYAFVGILVWRSPTLYQTATRGKGLVAIPKLFWWNAEVASIIS